MFRLAVLALVACNCNKKGEGSEQLSELGFTPGGVVGTGTVTFTSELGGKAHVEHSLDDGATWLSSAAVDTADGSIPVLGLRVATTHQVRVVVDDGESYTSAPIDVDIEPPPAGTPPFALNAWIPEQSCMDGGYALFSSLGQNKSGMGIVDRDGKYVWSVANDTEGTTIARVRAGRDGRTVLWNVADSEKVDDEAHIFRMNLDGSGRIDTRTLNGHHDFVELPDGDTFAWLGYEFRELALPDLGTTDPDPVVADVLYEGPEGLSVAEDAREIWNFFEETDWPHGIYVSDPEMEKCPTVPDADVGFIPGSCEFSHGNSLGYLPEDDAYLMMFRWIDTLVKVDRASGELIWVFGGPFDMFTGDDADRFVHGHFSDTWQAEDGLHVLIVDNHNDEENSNYTEFVLDEQDLTFERVWAYESDKFESLLGDIRRIPVAGCDNLLISFSAQGRVVEMTRAGDIVWDLGLGLGNITARVTFLPDLYDLSAAAE